MSYQSSFRTFDTRWMAPHSARVRRPKSQGRKNIPLGIAVAFGVSISGWAMIALVASALS